MEGQRSIVIEVPPWVNIDERTAKRIAKRLLRRLILVDLSRRLSLTPKEARELDKSIKEGALRRILQQ